MNRKNNMLPDIASGLSEAKRRIRTRLASRRAARFMRRRTASRTVPTRGLRRRAEEKGLLDRIDSMIAAASLKARGRIIAEMNKEIAKNRKATGFDDATPATKGDNDGDTDDSPAPKGKGKGRPAPKGKGKGRPAPKGKGKGRPAPKDKGCNCRCDDNDGDADDAPISKALSKSRGKGKGKRIPPRKMKTPKGRAGAAGQPGGARKAPPAKKTEGRRRSRLASRLALRRRMRKS